jgi:hypothetical protein
MNAMPFATRTLSSMFSLRGEQAQARSEEFH